MIAHHRDVFVEGTPVHRHLHVSTPSTTRSGRTRVRVTLLGGFRVEVDGTPTPAGGWARRSAAALVKLLALAPGRGMHREEVMDLLWPDESPDQSAPRLHKAAHFARRATGRADAVVLRGDVAWLFPEGDVVVDAVRFEELARVAVAAGDRALAGEALAWYGGELLPGDRYDDWATERRELLALRRLDVLRVAGEWRELAELAPTDEPAQVEIIRRHVAAGDGAAAISQYEHLERVLARELGLEPGTEAQRLHGEALALVAGPRPLAPPPVEALLAELALLAERQRVVLAALAVAGAPRDQVRRLAAVA
jgi:DNA-binding SARP family transcriptional activator